MNKDIRIAVNFLDHPKTVKLQRRLGDTAVLSLVRLWCHVAQNKPDGVLTGMDAEDIEIAARWSGNPGILVSTLSEVGWLDHQPDSGYSIHDWAEHNAYAFHAKDRQAKARKAASAKHAKDRSEHATSSTRAVLELVPSGAPSPSPSPSPSPQQASETLSRSPVVLLPLNDGTEYPITDSQCAEWKTLFPAVDVPQELRNMRAWLLANPRERKTHRGVLRFATSWLTRNQDKGRKASGSAKSKWEGGI